MYRFVFICFVVILGCPPRVEPPVRRDTPPQRIISTLPSITEVLFDIELGDRIVGDSFFTEYPPETAKIEKIGNQYGFHREKIVSLKPDLVILSIENVALRQSPSAPVLIVDHRTLKGVLDSYLVIGEVFGSDTLTTAQQKRQELIDKLNAFEARTKERKPIRTLICIDRSYGTGRIQNLFVAGANSFLNDAVTRAGGENTAASLGVLAPQLSAEGVIRLAPEVIIDLQVSGRDQSQSESDWYTLGDSVPAVKNRRILTLTDDFATIPGPRTPMLVEKIVRYFESMEIVP
jgi:iron complex transport system substrate-binding protein